MQNPRELREGHRIVAGPELGVFASGWCCGWGGSLRENPEIARENGDFIGFHRIYATEHGDLYSFMGFKWFNRIDSFHESFVWIYGIEHGTLHGNDIPPKNGTEAVTKKGFQCIKTQPNEEFNQEEPTKCRLQTVAQKNNRSFTNRRWRFNRFNNEINSCKIKHISSIDGIDAQIIWLGTGSLPFLRGQSSTLLGQFPLPWWIFFTATRWERCQAKVLSQANYFLTKRDKREKRQSGRI